jgi:hypothetical protein
MSYCYIFSKKDGKVLVKDEKGADTLMFKKSGWEAPVTYHGRVPVNTLNKAKMTHDSTFAGIKVDNQGQLSSDEERQELDRRAQHDKVWSSVILNMAKECEDYTEPADFAIIDERGNRQTNQRVIGMVGI